MKEITYASFEDSQFLSAMKLREDLEPFKENKIAAFAIELCFGVDDSISTLLPAVTGSGGDAKMDMIFVSREMRIVVICQAYMSNEMRKSARGNKGTDLSYAMNVLLHANESQLNDKIKPQVLDARSAIKDGEIKSLYVWYVHNCPESEQIKQDMSLAIPDPSNFLINLVVSLSQYLSTLMRWGLKLWTPIIDLHCSPYRSLMSFCLIPHDLGF
ncbi:hypothetical protein [Enterobacter hormaechei]|uniref:hypothetical protein n=1 Tax=Enterobacter hormaechei TaxID=158836 RepID=UPI003AB7EA7A